MKWSAKEERFLKRFYKNTSNRLMSVVMNRSTESIRKKAERNRLEYKSKKANDDRFVNHNRTKNYGWISANKML